MVIEPTKTTYDSLLELLQDPVLEELVGAVADVCVEVTPCMSFDNLKE